MAIQVVIEGASPRRKRSVWHTIISFAKKKPLGAVAGVLLLFLFAVAILADLVAPYDQSRQFYRYTLTPPSQQFLLGTDQVGRDVLSRVMHGSRISLYVGFAAVGIGVTAGTIIGIVSGFFGGKADIIIQRVMDAILVFPFLLKAIVLVAILGPGLNNVVIAIAFSQMPRANRVVRGTVLAAKENQYVEAATAMGATKPRIMFRHILPNIFAPIAIITSVDLGGAIVTEATLSFLGFGVPPPFASWGGMLSIDSRPFLERAPWLALAPGAAISLSVLAFNLLGDALRDVLDPRLRT